MNNQILELISLFLEERGYIVDYNNGFLCVSSEDSDTTIKVICEVIP